MQVALYARVSTSQQEKTDTIESQLEALHTYVATHNHTVLPEHIFLDNGVSGSRLDRPALDRLRDQARLGEFEAVILLSPDRLARSYPHQWLLLPTLSRCGSRKNYIPSLECRLDSTRCSQEGVRWHRSVLNAWTI